MVTGTVPGYLRWMPVQGWPLQKRNRGIGTGNPGNPDGADKMLYCKVMRSFWRIGVTMTVALLR